MRARRVHHDKDGERPWKRGRWLWVTTVAPALLLPVALVIASGILPGIVPQRTSLPRPPGNVERPEARQLGVTGQLPHQQRPSERLLNEAGNPRELVTGAGAPSEVPTGALGIPGPVLAAYHEAADRLAVDEPGCGLDWSVLASIGRVEGGHARSGGVDAGGTTVSAILGPRLAGRGVAAVPDTDRGVLDGDPTWDRAVGPMQFLPSTWKRFAIDGNGDGQASPHNVGDAAAAAGRVLCSGGGDLREPRELVRAVFGYNHSEDYVRTVVVWADAYSRGVTPTPGKVSPLLDSQRDVLAGSRLPDVAPPEVVIPGDSGPSGQWPIPVEPGLGQPSETFPPSSSAPPTSAPPTSAAPSAPPSSFLPPSSEPPSLQSPSLQSPSLQPPSSGSSSARPSSPVPVPPSPSEQPLPFDESFAQPTPFDQHGPSDQHRPSDQHGPSDGILPPQGDFPGSTSVPPSSSRPSPAHSPKPSHIPRSSSSPGSPSSPSR